MYNFCFCFEDFFNPFVIQGFISCFRFIVIDFTGKDLLYIVKNCFRKTE